MKKTARKLIASAMVLAVIGAGASAMAWRMPVSELPQTDSRGCRINYEFNRDNGIVSVTRFDNDGRPGAPERIGQIVDQNLVNIFADEVDLSYLPQINARGHRIAYSFNKNNGIVSVTRFNNDGIPSAPQMIGQMVDEHTVRIFGEI